MYILITLCNYYYVVAPIFISYLFQRGQEEEVLIERMHHHPPAYHHVPHRGFPQPPTLNPSPPLILQEPAVHPSPQDIFVSAFFISLLSNQTPPNPTPKNVCNKCYIWIFCPFSDWERMIINGGKILYFCQVIL